jgi:hypothetical protein
MTSHLIPQCREASDTFPDKLKHYRAGHDPVTIVRQHFLRETGGARPYCAILKNMGTKFKKYSQGKEKEGRKKVQQGNKKRTGGKKN